MAGLRRMGRVPGKLASSIWSCSSVSTLMACARARVGDVEDEASGTGTALVGSLGWLMLFCPVMTVPSSRPAAMWWAKFVFNAGKTLMLSGTPQILDSR